METLHLVVYFTALICLFLYVSSLMIAVFASVVVIATARFWEVNPKDPNTKGEKGVIRQLQPFDFIVVGKAGNPTFPVVRQTAARLSVVGLQQKEMRKDNVNDWEVVEVGEDEEYKSHIHSRYGWLDPVYIFRKMIYETTGRHVVRVWVPFFLFGFYELYAPITMTLLRARPKISNEELKERPSMVVIERIEGSVLDIVQDETDHIRYEFPLRVITDTLPTKDGHSLRADVTIVLRLENLHRVVSWKDWSSQIRSVVANTTGKYFRKGTFETVYATDAGGVEKLQEDIQSALTDSTAHCFKVKVVHGKKTQLSIMDVIGFTCLNVTLNDLIPGDKESKKAIEEIMAITATGRSKAKAAGSLIAAQTKALSKADAQSRSVLATLTAAQNTKGRIDFIIADRGDATFALQNRVVKNTEKGE